MSSFNLINQWHKVNKEYDKMARRIAQDKLTLNKEEASTGVVNLEKEYVFYARVDSLANLKAMAANIEHHEQWEIRIPKTNKNATACRMRVRKTTYPNNEAKPAEYVLTVKTKTADGAESEVANPSSEDAFKQFVASAEQGMIKTRYTVPIEGRRGVWEIDTFKTKDGKEVSWCKLDYEVVKGEENLEIPNLPSGFVDIIPAIGKTPVQEAQVRVLYDRYFITPNPHVKPEPTIKPQEQLQDDTTAK